MKGLVSLLVSFTEFLDFPVSDKYLEDDLQDFNLSDISCMLGEALEVSFLGTCNHNFYRVFHDKGLVSD